MILSRKKHIENESDNNITNNYSQRITTNIISSNVGQSFIKIIDTYQIKLDILNAEIDKVKGIINLVFENSKMKIAEYEVIDHYYLTRKNVGDISDICNYYYGYIGQLKRQAISKFSEYNNCKNLQLSSAILYKGVLMLYCREFGTNTR